MSKSKLIPISKIVADDAVHPRASINKDVVAEYAEAMKEGSAFPSIIVYQDGAKYFLADGWHRLEACKQLGRSSIDADVRKGSRRDAILFAVKANVSHGIRRTNQDKRKAVEIILADKEWQKWAINEIADQCAVSWGLAREVYNDVKDKFHLPKLEDREERTVARKGTTYTQKAARIGKAIVTKGSEVVPKIAEMRNLTAEVCSLLYAENKHRLVERFDKVAKELHVLVGEAAECNYRLEKGLRKPLNVYERPRQDGVNANPEFTKKKLCNYSVGVGLICGHQCTYCSAPSSLRTHGVFKEIQQTSAQRGNAIVDPNSAERVRAHIPKKLTGNDIIQLSTIDDAWSPEARKYDLGRKIMKVLLEETPAQIRVLTSSLFQPHSRHQRTPA